MKRHARVTQRLSRAVVAALTERATPQRLGWAVALGCLVGSSPFYGFHLPICLALATLLRLNRAVTYFAANISIPPLLPFTLFASLQLGAYVLDGHWMPLSIDSIETLDATRFAEQWLVGGLIFGTAMAAVLGPVTYALARGYRRRNPPQPDPLAPVFSQVAARFASQGRFVLGYVRGKLTHDPVYRQLAQRAPHEGPVTDIGCGRGQTSILLKLMQPSLQITGTDWDESKLERARLAASGLGSVTFTHADARTASFLPSSTLLLIDVLHYNPRDVQDAILRRAASALNPGGVLYLRDVDASVRGWARLNIWQEQLGRLVRFNRGATLCFRPAHELEALLRAEGLTVDRVGSSEGLPLANVLIVARRPPGGGPSP